MNTTCQISNVNQDNRTGESWGFWLCGDTLYLNSYMFCTKKTKQHKLKVVKEYSRLGFFPKGKIRKLTLAEVPFTPEIKERAKAALMEKIAVKTWAERGGGDK